MQVQFCSQGHGYYIYNSSQVSFFYCNHVVLAGPMWLQLAPEHAVVFDAPWHAHTTKLLPWQVLPGPAQFAVHMQQHA